MFTNRTVLRSDATRQAARFSGGTPGRRLSEPTHGMPCQPFVDPAGTIAPVPGWVEGSIR
jgi:hypothetical protein